MATVDDAPEPLRGLARKIPAETREHLGFTELRFRVEAAGAAFDQAAYADEREAKRLRREGELYLSAVSFRAYMLTASLLAEEMKAARARGDDRAERELGERLEDFSKRNPQPVMERAANGEDVAAVIAEITQGKSADRNTKPRWLMRLMRKG
jgi:hypothetical protein